MTEALEGGEWSAARPGRTLPPGKTRYPFYRRLVGPQGRSGRAENLVPTGIRSRTVQPVAQSLYRLSYPAHNSTSAHLKFLNFSRVRVRLIIRYITWTINEKFSKDSKLLLFENVTYKSSLISNEYLKRERIGVTLHENATNEKIFKFLLRNIGTDVFRASAHKKGRRDRVFRPTVLIFLLCTQLFKIKYIT
jgi:hypothetical protein